MTDLPSKHVVKQVGPSFPVSSDFLLYDSLGNLFDLLQDRLYRTLDRELHPWNYPDRNPMPHLVLFPRLDRLCQFAARWRDRRRDDDE